MLDAATDGFLENGSAFVRAMLLLLLCGADGAADALPLRAPPLVSLFLLLPRGFAMFLNVMIHSISSPAYIVGSFQCTKARMFDSKGGMGGIIVVVAAAAVALLLLAARLALHGEVAAIAFFQHLVAFSLTSRGTCLPLSKYVSTHHEAAKFNGRDSTCIVCETPVMWMRLRGHDDNRASVRRTRERDPVGFLPPRL